MTALHQAAQKAVEALKALRKACSEQRSMQGREFDALGIQTNDAINALTAALQQQPEPDKRRVAMETVYFRRSPNEPWDSLTVPAGTATQHVREELIESIVSAADGIAASPSTTQQQEAGSGPTIVAPPLLVSALCAAEDLIRWGGRYISVEDAKPVCKLIGDALASVPAAAPSTPAREEALRLAGAAGLDPDPEVVASPLGPGEDEYLSWVKLIERNALPVNRAACEVERDAAKCWRQTCAEAGVCAAPAAGLPAVDSQTNPPADADGGA